MYLLPLALDAGLVDVRSVKQQGSLEECTAEILTYLVGACAVHSINIVLPRGPIVPA